MCCFVFITWLCYFTFAQTTETDTKTCCLVWKSVQRDPEKCVVCIQSFATTRQQKDWTLFAPMLCRKLLMPHRCQLVNHATRKSILSHVTSLNTVEVFLDRSKRFFIKQHFVNSPCVLAMEQLRAVFSDVQFTDINRVFELLLEEGVSSCRLNPFYRL